MAAVEFVTGVDQDRRGPRASRPVVTSSAGYPLDKTYYQTVKGMVTPLDILEPGGTLIIASACSEGFGSPEFREAQARLVELGPERFLATLTAKSLAEIDEWQTEMQLKSMRARTRATLHHRPRRRGACASPASTLAPIDRSLRWRDAIARHNDPDARRHSGRPYVVPGSSGRREWLLAIHLDAVGGIAGDMFVAAMVDALAGSAGPRAGGCRWPCCRPEPRTPESATPGTSAGLRCLRFELSAPVGDHHHRDATLHAHRLVATWWRAIEGRAARRAGTAEHAAGHSRATWRRPEPQIHRCSVDEVHFHEIGRLGFADGRDGGGQRRRGARGRALERLRPAAAAAASCARAHGLLPVPAPATARLLEGSPGATMASAESVSRRPALQFCAISSTPRRGAASPVACRAPAPVPARANFGSAQHPARDPVRARRARR